MFLKMSITLFLSLAKMVLLPVLSASTKLKDLTTNVKLTNIAIK